MTVTLRRVDSGDSDELVAFLVSNSFPFHVAGSLSVEAARSRVEDGRYWSATSQGYWIMADELTVGLAVLEDLDDDAPLFDLRLADSARGSGIGSAALRALTREVFDSLPEMNRFEGQTRVDNVAMRRAFVRCGFVKEAHYREAWPSPDGRLFDSVAYVILRRDWESGETTPVDWDDAF